MRPLTFTKDRAITSFEWKQLWGGIYKSICECMQQRCQRDLSSKLVLHDEARGCNRHDGESVAEAWAGTTIRCLNSLVCPPSSHARACSNTPVLSNPHTCTHVRRCVRTDAHGQGCHVRISVMMSWRRPHSQIRHSPQDDVVMFFFHSMIRTALYSNETRYRRRLQKSHIIHTTIYCCIID